MDHKTLFSRSSKIVARKSGDEYILVPIKNNIADMKAVYTMNSTAAFVWDNIDGIRSVGDLALEVAKEFEVDKETALNDVAELLKEMEQYLIVIK